MTGANFERLMPFRTLCGVPGDMNFATTALEPDCISPFLHPNCQSPGTPYYGQNAGFKPGNLHTSVIPI